MAGGFQVYAQTPEGRIIAANDDWTLSDHGFNAPNDAGVFVRNIAACFTGGKSGKFLAYSDHLGLNGGMLAGAMAGFGHTWVIDTSMPLATSTLMDYDGVFLGVIPVDNQVLIDYVKAGGNVYVYSGGDTEPDKWNTFLQHFGLQFKSFNNGVMGDIPITSDHPLFREVDYLYHAIGTSVEDLDLSDPKNQVVATYQDEGLFAIYDSIGNACEITFRRADSNGDGTVDISDAINTLGFLFLGTGKVDCMDAGDANDDGLLDISDAIITLEWLFVDTTKLPPAPGPFTPGPDPTNDALTCNQYPSEGGGGGGGSVKETAEAIDKSTKDQQTKDSVKNVLNIVPKGTLNVAPNPPTYFHLDGKYKGYTPFTVKDLYEGPYAVNLTRYGYETYQTTVKVLPGQTITFKPTLKLLASPSPSPTASPTPSPSPSPNLTPSPSPVYSY